MADLSTKPVKSGYARRRLDEEGLRQEEVKKQNSEYYQNGSAWKVPTRFPKGNLGGHRKRGRHNVASERSKAAVRARGGR